MAAVNGVGLGFDSVAVSRKPAAITHTHIDTPALQHSRFISEAVAGAVTANGGNIDAWPAGIGKKARAEFIDRINFLIPELGKEQIALASDMDANYKPVLGNYRKMSLVVGALQRRGHDEAGFARVTGGNVLRDMDAA